MHYNGLLPSEAERLAILAEECGEVVQLVGKILRHGYSSYHPDDKNKVANQVLLEKELGDVYTVIDWMAECGDVHGVAIHKRLKDKREQLAKYTHHQDRKQLRSTG